MIHIKEFDTPTVRRMVEFLYTGDYDQGKPEFVNPAIDTDDEFLEAPVENAEEAGDAENAENVENAENAEEADDDLLFERQPFNPDTDIQTIEAGIYDININAYQPPSPSGLESVVKEWGPDDETAATEFFNTFSTQLGIHAIADYYMMNDLKNKAIEKVKVLLKKTVWSAKGFLAVAKEAFETTPSTAASTSAGSNRQQQEEETLRDVMINTASEHFPEITRTHEFTRDINPEFAALLLQKAASRFDALRNELKEQELDSRLRWTIDTGRIAELMDVIRHLQAQNAELNNCIARIQNLSTCLICGRAFNVLIREEGSNNGGDDDGYDADGSVDGFPILPGAQQTNVKKHVIECKRCNLHGMQSGDLLRGDRSGLFNGDELFQGVAELFGDELPAEPWVEGENDQFVGALYGNDDDDDV